MYGDKVIFYTNFMFLMLLCDIKFVQFLFTGSSFLQIKIFVFTEYWTFFVMGCHRTFAQTRTTRTFRVHSSQHKFVYALGVVHNRTVLCMLKNYIGYESHVAP